MDDSKVVKEGEDQIGYGRHGLRRGHVYSGSN